MHCQLCPRYSIGAYRTLEVCEVALLVEAGLVQAEGVDDVDLLLGRVLGALLLLLGGGVGTSVCSVLAAEPSTRIASTHRTTLLRQ
jgi:hypothetical protein